MPSLIGLFGGTFDPPHIGHLILAAEAQAQLGLENLLWIPTPDPPHKQEQAITPLEHRLAMVKLAIADDPHFELSTIELERPGPHFTLDTVKTIAEQNPTAGLVYLMGGDSLHDLPAWHLPVELVSALHGIGVMRRPGDSINLHALENKIPGLTSKVRFVEAPMIDIASNEIRLRVAAGLPFRYFLSPAVFEYIVEHRLYC